MNLKPLSFAAIALAAFVVAAQQKPIDTKDWKSFATKDGKFSIKAPKSWGPANPDDDATKAELAKIKANNPQLAKIFEKRDSNFDLYLLDYDDAAKGVTNLNVLTIKDSGLTTEMYPEMASELFKQASLKDTGYKVIDQPVGKMLTYWGVLVVRLGDGKTMNFKANGYVCIKDDVTYICTMTSSADADKIQKPVFDAMAKTIVLK